MATVFLTACGDKASIIDRPEDQGYNDPGLRVRDSIEIDGLIDRIVIEGVWSHPAETQGPGTITQDPENEKAFRAEVAVDDDSTGWETGQLDLMLEYQGTDKFGNIALDTVLVKDQ